MSDWTETESMTQTQMLYDSFETPWVLMGKDSYLIWERVRWRRMGQLVSESLWVVLYHLNCYSAKDLSKTQLIVQVQVIIIS